MRKIQLGILFALGLMIAFTPGPDTAWRVSHLMHHTWTCVQGNASCTNNHVPTLCTANSGVCTQTITAPTAGNLGKLVLEQGTSARTVSSVTAPACDSPGWVKDTSNNTQTNASIEVWSCKSLTGGGTSATATWSANCITNACITGFLEFSSNVGNIAVDAGATPANNSSGSSQSPASPALTVSGNNDVIVIGIVHTSTVTACGQSYVCTVTSSHYAQGYKLNLTSYTAPGWTTSASGTWGQVASAYQELASSSAAPTPPAGLMLGF